jgi:hypothetical protein
MIYIFYSDNKWFLHPGDLPVRPNDPLKYGFTVEMDEYNQSIADIKAKALEIANPELLGIGYNQHADMLFIVLNKKEYLVKEGEFYQWPAEVTIENNKAILKL